VSFFQQACFFDKLLLNELRWYDDLIGRKSGGFTSSNFSKRRRGNIHHGNRLLNLNLEQHVVRVLMTPLEVFSLLSDFHLPELTVVAMLFPQVYSISLIFMVVPRMIVVAISIVVSLLMIVGVRCHWGNQGSADEKRGQNHKAVHVFVLG
jgi:hypothetical protein